MVVDIYQYFKNNPRYNKLIGDDYLFVEYKCPIKAEEFELLTASHLITYVVNGKKDWIGHTTTHRLSAGDSIFVRKGVYVTRQYFEEDYCVMLFFISDKFIKRFVTENANFSRRIDTKLKDRQIYAIHPSETYHALIESIFHYLKQGTNIPRGLVELKFNELLFNIALNPKNKDILDAFNAIGHSSRSGMQDIMMMNFRSDLSIADFAHLSGRSLSAFKRDFNEHFKTTPSKWLRSKRLEYAKGLLLETNLNISEVCNECGFRNNSHFTSAFKSEFSMPPGQFKAKYATA